MSPSRQFAGMTTITGMLELQLFLFLVFHPAEPPAPHNTGALYRSSARKTKMGTDPHLVTLSPLALLCGRGYNGRLCEGAFWKVQTEDDVKLHEYQSKRLFGEYGIPVPEGEVAATPEEARRIAEEMGGPVVVKAQVLVGGRGKAGGVKLAKTPEEAEARARDILGMDIKGLTVEKVLIDPAADINEEIYLGVTLDRAARQNAIMASAAGGVDIEEVAATTPERIRTIRIDPAVGLADYQKRELAYGIGLSDKAQLRQFADIVSKLYDVYTANDATLAEVNPLVIGSDGTLLALDGKVDIDDSALARHPDLAEMRDLSAETEAEQKARAAGLTYIDLDGTIGCMVNGAGLAMATMDVIKLYGGEPANFLDIGGGARADKVAAAIEII
ncbi:MAG: ADP-forming succinate--CoA ligase subunit beta, partial [Ardenticatenaceae bacterium]